MRSFFTLGKKQLDLKKYLNNWSNMRFDKNSRIILLVIYGAVMLTAIASSIDTLTFVILFAVVPVFIYIFVKKIFPKN